jgi:hypothetical protein
VTDPEVVTLFVAQSMMGIPSDARFIAVARKCLGHLFLTLPDREGFYKRREALHGLRTRLTCRFLALAATIALNHRLRLPSRSLAQYTAQPAELLILCVSR